MGFSAGFNSGASAVNSYYASKRQAMLDERDGALHTARMEDIAQTKRLNTDIASAGKQATFSENAPTLNTGDGARVYDMEGGADVAASDARQFTRMAPQAPAPTQGQSFAVNGQTVPDRVTMMSTVKAYDEGANERIAQAYRANGRPLEAINMSNAVMENRAKTLGLETAELKHLNTTYNNKVIGRLKAPGGTMFENAAQIVSDAQFGGLEGSTGRVELSTDGKTVNIFATKDGKDSPPLAFQNNAAGQAQLMQRFMKADDATQLAFLKDAADREAAQAKAALEERKVDAIALRADTDSRKLDGMMAGLMGRSGGSARAGQSATAEQAFNPLGSFDSKKAQAVAFEQASKTTDATGEPISPEAQGQLAQKIYRSMEDSFAMENTSRERTRVFKSAAAAAKTPAELQALRTRAAQSGYTDQEMAQMDPRLALPKAQVETKTAPDVPARPAKAPSYVPPVDSPAGKAAASRDASKAVSMVKTMQTKKTATDAAASAIQSGDAGAAQAAQDMDGFSDLPASTKAQIRKIVFGR